MPQTPPRDSDAADRPDRRESVVRELRPAAPLSGALARATALGDAELVAELRAHVAGGSGRGDEAYGRAARALFDSHGRPIERLLFSLLGPEADAEDLLQDVFLLAIEGISTLDEPAKLRSWLRGIAVHTARQWIRRRTRWKWLAFVAEPPEPPPPFSRVASEEITEATRCTFDVLRGMGADHRMLFSLRFIEGMDVADIAVTFDISVSTAKRRLRNAERNFVARARRVPALAAWLEEGGRWASE